MVKLGPASILLSTLLVGCTQIPKTPVYAPNAGAKTCDDFRHAAGNRATEEFLAGTVLTLAGLVGVGTGIAMGPDNNPDAPWHERSRYLLVMAPSAVLTGLGVGLMARSQETETLAYQTSGVLAQGKNEADRFLYYQCVSARGDWSHDHAEMTRVQVNLIKENLATALAAQEAAAAAAAQVQTATTLAADAKLNAAKATQIASGSAEATKDLAAITEKLVSAPPKPSEPVTRAPKALPRETKSDFPPFPSAGDAGAPKPAQVILGQQR